MVLIVNVQGRQVVAQRCERAARAGVKEGMSLSHARALLPAGAVEVRPYEAGREVAALRALARWAVQFSPVVAADPPDGLLMDVTGCQRLYRGEQRMMRTISREIQRLGFTVQVALAPTVGGAWALARCGPNQTVIDSDEQLPDALAPLAVWSLRIDSTSAAALMEVAIDRIDQLYELPRAALAQRFGDELLRRLDQALGRVFEPIEPQRYAPPAEAQQAFTSPVKQLEAVELTVRRLLVELAEQLQRRESGARRLVLTLDRLDAQQIAQTIELSQPSRDATHLWKLLQPVVEKVNLGYGVERITVTAAQTGQLPHQQHSHWQSPHEDTARIDKTLGELVDQLTGRLGPRRVNRLEMIQAHVPEWSFELKPMMETHGQPSPPAMSDRPMTGDRPSMLYPRPIPVQVTLLTPDGPVMSISGSGTARKIVTTIGPERIRMPWWRRVVVYRATRDYFKLQDEHGCWWWVYCQVAAKRWFVHGQWM